MKVHWPGKDSRAQECHRTPHLSGLITVTVVVMALTACSNPTVSTPPLTEHTDPAFGRMELDEISKLSKAFVCDELYLLEEDMYFYDRMKGFDCYRDGEVTLIVRAYRNNDSPGQTLATLSGAVTDDRRLIATANWVAVGAQANLRKLQTLAGTTSAGASPLPTAKSLSEHQSALGFCVVAGSTVAVNILEKTPVVNIVESYPGLWPIAEAVAAKIEESGLSEQQRPIYGLAQHGSPIKDYCEASLPLAR